MQRNENTACGLYFWHPSFLQRFANTKWFMAVYGLLGTVQAMSYLYFIVTLTTVEKRFKIPSQTTGIILSGNEISQILLSLILSYLGGQRNRPRWIAWGMVFCGLSCFILALPHFFYGGGDEVLQYTKEYVEKINEREIHSLVINNTFYEQATHHFCTGNDTIMECTDELITIVPLVLIFLSQFVLGIGNTLYYSLGQTYLDDNSKKTNTPWMLALAMSLRMIGPVIGFFLGYISLNTFIEPTKTPLIDQKDPRWLGAWWFGWIILGSVMLLFSGFVGMFPKELPKKNNYQQSEKLTKDFEESSIPLAIKTEFSSLERIAVSSIDNSSLKDFPKALMRLLTNKLLIFNIISAIFYILGAAGHMTFIAKYMEVQFHQTAQNATIVIGPVTITGMVLGLLISGLVLSKYRPSASKVLFWNVIVGFVYMLGQISYLFIYCGDTSTLIQNGVLNLTSSCNTHCSCDSVQYSPVCHLSTGTTYFSSCHAGCNSWSQEEKAYSNCSCISEKFSEKNFKQKFKSNELFTNNSILMTTDRNDMNLTLSDFLTPGACLQGCTMAYYTYSLISMIINWFGSSGRIGNVLVNYRAVHTQDKSFAQGLALMMLSLFALIPGPIIFGRLIDRTCLIWTQQCNNQGRCQLYDQKKFRFYLNLTALGLTLFGVFFDYLVWYYGRNLNLYEETEEVQIKHKDLKTNKKVLHQTNSNFN